MLLNLAKFSTTEHVPSTPYAVAMLRFLRLGIFSSLPPVGFSTSEYLLVATSRQLGCTPALPVGTQVSRYSCNSGFSQPHPIGAFYS
eukprot:SAG11_NODE_140_length_15009_cov_7.342522_14_plen_87_part_00